MDISPWQWATEQLVIIDDIAARHKPPAAHSLMIRIDASYAAYAMDTGEEDASQLMPRFAEKLSRYRESAERGEHRLPVNISRLL